MFWVTVFFIYAVVAFVYLFMERVRIHSKALAAAYNGLAPEPEAASTQTAAFWFFFMGWAILPCYLYLRWKEPQDYA